MARNETRDLHEAADRATKVTIFDRFVTGSIDVVEFALPYGGVLAAILRQVVPNDHLEYLNDFLHDVVDRIEEFDEAKVDRAYFQTDGWMNDVRRVVESQASQRNREKRAHFVAALANSAKVDRPVDAIRLRYFDVLESLRPSHLELLAVVVTARETRGPDGLDEYLTTRLVDQDLENIKLDWGDLERAGILQSIPTASDRPAQERYASALNAFGRRFAEFIAAIPDDEQAPRSPATG